MGPRQSTPHTTSSSLRLVTPEQFGEEREERAVQAKPFCDVLRISRDKQADLDLLQELRRSCDDESFAEGYACSKGLRMDDKTDILYIGFDRQNGKVCGWVHVYDFGKAIELESVASRSGKDLKYKGSMIRLFDAIMDDAREAGKLFAEIGDFTAEGGRFYTRYGFKLLGTTRTLIYPLQSTMPKLQDIRDMQTVEFANSWKRGFKDKLPYTEESDDIERWQEDYGQYDDISARQLGKNPEEIGLIYNDFSGVRRFPSWMYTTKEERERWFHEAEAAERAARQGQTIVHR